MTVNHDVRRAGQVRLPPVRRRRRQGSTYLLVLGIASVLTVIGLGALTVSRVNVRAAGQSQDWSEAQWLAFSAFEHAMAAINSTSDWRTAYDGQTVLRSLGRGTFTWRLAGESGGGIADDPNGSFYVYATGTVGGAACTFRVRMIVPRNVIVAGLTIGTTVALSSGAKVDSFDSSKGPYGGANVGAEALVRTNSTASGAVSLSSNATIKGSVQVGPGGNPDQVISTGPNAKITGATGAMSQEADMPVLAAPSGMGPSVGNLSYDRNETATLSADLHVNDLSLKSNSKLTISGNVTILAENDFSISGNASIEVLPGSTLNVYVKGAMAFSSNAATTVSGGKLSSLKFYNLGTNPVSLTSNSKAQGVFISPGAPVELGSNAEISGVVLARTLKLSSNAEFHEDRNITNQRDPVELPGGSSKPRPDAWVRVVH